MAEETSGLNDCVPISGFGVGNLSLFDPLKLLIMVLLSTTERPLSEQELVQRMSLRMIERIDSESDVMELFLNVDGVDLNFLSQDRMGFTKARKQYAMVRAHHLIYQ